MLSRQPNGDTPRPPQRRRTGLTTPRTPTLTGVISSGPAGVPAEFDRALRSLRAARLRPEVHLVEVPGPGRIAPYTAALTAEVRVPKTDDELASGRFVVLHDPAGHEGWDGTFRLVTMARAHLEADLGADDLLAEVAWTWFDDALADAGVVPHAAGGTVTRVLSRSFGSLADRPAEVEVEIRASWTALDGDLAPHLQAWAVLLCQTAGLPPVPPGVTVMGSRR